MKQLTAGILFASGGGVECGMVDVGIDPVWAVEWNPHNTRLSEVLIHSHERNFPDCKVVAKPVQQVNWRRLPKVDILWASPMCSNFSMAKNAEEELEDIQMAMAVCDAIAILKPRYFLLENVPQYAKVPKKKERTVSFDAIVSTLELLGYSVKYSVENFADYGLPQARKRLILRAALEAAVPPLPKKAEKHVGWYEAIADLIPDLPPSELLPNQQKSVDKYLINNPPVPLLIDRVGGRGDYKIKPGHLPANTILRSRFTDGNNRNRNRCGDVRLPNGEIKALTIECVRRLQGFPNWYELPAEIAIAGSILGYSVPPLFVKQLFAVLLKSDEIASPYAPDDKVGQAKEVIAQSLPSLPALQGSDYKLIVCDPPWSYSLRELDATHRGRCPYPNMSDNEILNLPVGAIAAKDSYILLWVTNNHLSLGFECLKRWGFEYKSIFTWIKTVKGDNSKPNIGLGHYGRNCTEHILVGIKGKPGSFTALGLTNIPNVLFAPRGTHSQKPEQFWEIAEKLGEKLGGKRMELFARKSREGWSAWGLEAGSIDEGVDGSSASDLELCKTNIIARSPKCLTQKSRSPNMVAASGSLVCAPAYKLKSGDDGATRYLYQWRERKGSIWTTRSKHVPIGKLGRVRSAIAARQPISEILELL